MSRFGGWLCWMFAGCAIAGMLTPWLADVWQGPTNRLSWMLSLAAHWQWLYVGLLLLALLQGMFFDKRVWLLSIACVLPLLSASPKLSSTESATDLRIVSANLQKNVATLTALRQWLSREPADVIVLLEVTPQIDAALSAFSDYPYRLSAPEPSAFGIALLSRLPLRYAQVRGGLSETAWITAEISVRDRAVQLAAVHPLPPMSPQAESKLRRKLALATQMLTQSDHPAVVAGDFNATPWSPAMRQLDSSRWRRVMPLWPTWPTNAKGVFGIPIDHVIATSHWRVRRAARGPALGSDHFPVVVELALKPQQ